MGHGRSLSAPLFGIRESAETCPVQIGEDVKVIPGQAQRRVVTRPKIIPTKRPGASEQIYVANAFLRESSSWGVADQGFCKRPQAHQFDVAAHMDGRAFISRAGQ